jgi:hypothetical protein
MSESEDLARRQLVWAAERAWLLAGDALEDAAKALIAAVWKRLEEDETLDAVNAAWASFVVASGAEQKASTELDPFLDEIGVDDPREVNAEDY